MTHWKDLIPWGEQMLDRSYPEEADFRGASDFWRDLAVVLWERYGIALKDVQALQRELVEAMEEDKP
jgi:hypothetical protein